MYSFFRYKRRTNPLDIYDGHKVNLPDGTEIIIPKIPYKIVGRKISCMFAHIIKQCEKKWALVEMKNGDKLKLYIWEVKHPNTIIAFRFNGSNFILEQYDLEMIKTIIF